MEDLRYPIGQFEAPAEIDAGQIEAWTRDIERLPAQLRALVEPLAPEQLDTPYRPGGWTVRQVVHHLADSHLNSLVRFKWALTEDSPTIKAYWEDRWAELADYAEPVELSLDFLDALHRRWVVLLRSLSPADLERQFVHPDSGPVQLTVNVGIYAWHGKHHLAHVDGLLRRRGWID